MCARVCFCLGVFANIANNITAVSAEASIAEVSCTELAPPHFSIVLDCVLNAIRCTRRCRWLMAGQNTIGQAFGNESTAISMHTNNKHTHTHIDAHRLHRSSRSTTTMSAVKKSGNRNNYMSHSEIVESPIHLLVYFNTI